MPGSLADSGTSPSMPNFPVKTWISREGPDLSWTRNLPMDAQLPRGDLDPSCRPGSLVDAEPPYGCPKLPVKAAISREGPDLSWTRNLPFDAAISHGRGTSPSMLRSLADAGTSPSMPRSLADAAISREGPGFSWTPEPPRQCCDLSRTRNLPVDAGISRGLLNLPVDAGISRGRGTSPSM